MPAKHLRCLRAGLPNRGAGTSARQVVTALFSRRAANPPTPRRSYFVPGMTNRRRQLASTHVLATMSSRYRCQSYAVKVVDMDSQISKAMEAGGLKLPETAKIVSRSVGDSRPRAVCGADTFPHRIMLEGFQISQGGGNSGTVVTCTAAVESAKSAGVGCRFHLTSGDALQLDIMKRLDHPNIAAWLFKQRIR